MKSLTKKDIMLIVTCFMMMTIVFGGFNLFGLFIVPVTEDLGFSRSAFTGHMTIMIFASIGLNLAMAKILVAFRRRPLFITAAFLTTIFYASFGLATKLWHFYLLAGCIGLASTILVGPGVSVLINENFPRRIRGRVVGGVMAGSGFGTMILSPVLTQFIEKVGWREAYFLLGALVLVIVVPLVILFIREPDPSVWDEADEDAPAEIKRHIAYPQPKGIEFFAIVTLLLLSLVSSVFHMQMMPYAIEVGISETVASFMISLYAGFLIIGKIGLGTLCDKIGTKKGFNLFLVVLLLSQVTTVACAVMPWMFIPSVVLYGIGNTTSTVGIVLYITALYGEENYNKVVGKYMAFMSLGSVPSPVFGSMFYDLTGSYVPAFIVMTVASVIVCTFSMITFRRVEAQHAQYRAEHPELMRQE